MRNRKHVQKEVIRNQIWTIMEKENIARFSKPVHNRIPNFISAEEAGERLASI